MKGPLLLSLALLLAGPAAAQLEAAQLEAAVAPSTPPFAPLLPPPDNAMPRFRGTSPAPKKRFD